MFPLQPVGAALLMLGPSLSTVELSDTIKKKSVSEIFSVQFK